MLIVCLPHIFWSRRGFNALRREFALQHCGSWRTSARTVESGSRYCFSARGDLRLWFKLRTSIGGHGTPESNAECRGSVFGFPYSRRNGSIFPKSAEADCIRASFFKTISKRRLLISLASPGTRV